MWSPRYCERAREKKTEQDIVYESQDVPPIVVDAWHKGSSEELSRVVFREKSVCTRSDIESLVLPRMATGPKQTIHHLVL